MNFNTTLLAISITIFFCQPVLSLPFNYNDHYNLVVQVIDQQGLSLPGVTVTSDLAKFKGITDDQGKIELTGMKLNEQITFSFVGFETTTIEFGQLKEKKGQLILQETLYNLPVIQMVGRRDDHVKYIPQQINIIDQSSIERTNAPTTADILGQHGGVFIQKSQLGGGSPIIRGFEANRVLLVVDGVRMNNAIYRSGHLQNSITIDPSMLEQVEVLHGPGSLMYGSDALGGVIHFRTKAPKLKQEDGTTGVATETNVFTRYASAGKAITTHLNFNIGGKKWAYLGGITYSNFGDLRAGNNRPQNYPEFGKRLFYSAIENGEDVVLKNENPDIQIGTAYSQIDFIQKVRFQPSEKLYFDLNWQYSRSSDIPRYDQLTETGSGTQQFKFAQWYYGPQVRNLISLKARLFHENNLFDKGTIIIAYQRIGEDQHNRRFGDPVLESTINDVDVYSLNADFDKIIGDIRLGTINYGFEATNNHVHSIGKGENVFTNEEVSGVNSRYPSDRNNLYSLGAYTNYIWRSIDTNLVFNLGLRYSYSHLYSRFSADDPIQWPSYYLEGIAGSNDALTWATGLSYFGPNQWSLKATVGTAFRSPNVDDFAKFREKNGFVSVPNPDLRPEKSFSAELTLAKSIFAEKNSNRFFEQITLSTTAFYTRLKGAIVREHFALPDGAQTFISNNDTLSVQANINANRAYIYGFAGNVSIAFSKNWNFNSSVNFTYGNRSVILKNSHGEVIFDELVPQGHIPPVYGQTSLLFSKEKFSFEAVVRYNGAKRPEDFSVGAVVLDADAVCGSVAYDRTGTPDNIELGIIKSDTYGCSSIYGGFYGWTTFNFYTEYAFHPQLSVNLGVENITDLHYRPFASGVSAPGRNIILTLRGRF